MGREVKMKIEVDDLVDLLEERVPFIKASQEVDVAGIRSGYV
jgi:hypothetical protein